MLPLHAALLVRGGGRLCAARRAPAGDNPSQRHKSKCVDIVHSTVPARLAPIVLELLACACGNCNSPPALPTEQRWAVCSSPSRNTTP